MDEVPVGESESGVGGVRTPALSPLRIRAFRRLLTARTINEAGNWLGLVALASLVFAETGSAIASAGLMLAMQVVPAVIAPGLIGRLEARDLRRVLISLYALEAAAFAALAAIAGSFSLPAVLVIAALDGILALSTRALTRASIATVLEPTGELRQGNALVNIGATVAVAAGPILGGFMVAAGATVPALLANTASFTLCALVFAFSAPLPRLIASGAESEGWRERLADALRYLRERTLVRRLILGQAVVLAFFALTVPVDVVYASDALDAGGRGFGLLLGCWGIGMVVGGLVFAGAHSLRLSLMLAGSTLLIGLAYLGLAAAPTLLVACVAAFLGGTGNGVQWVALVTAVQELVGRAYQARVVGLLESAASGADALGFLAGGVIAATVAPRASYLVAGLGVIAVLALALVFVPRRRRRPVGAEPQTAQ